MTGHLTLNRHPGAPLHSSYTVSLPPLSPPSILLSLQKHGQELDDDSSFGKAVAKTAEAFQSLLDLQYDMDNALNQSVIEPWKRQIDQEFKDIAYHRKKVRTRRLDFDFKRTTNAANVAKGKPEKCKPPFPMSTCPPACTGRSEFSILRGGDRPRLRSAKGTVRFH